MPKYYRMVLKFSLESLVTLILTGFRKLPEPFMYLTVINKSFYVVKNEEYIVYSHSMFIVTEAPKITLTYQSFFNSFFFTV